MRAIIEDMNCEKHNLNLSDEQIKFARWLVDNEILYSVEVIDEMEWEDIK